MKMYKLLLSFIVIFLLSAGAVFASEKYITDDAGVLSKTTIANIDDKLRKIYDNTGVTVKFNTTTSLDEKSIEQFAKDYAKKNISGEKYILFTVSINDRKNNLLVGNDVNNIMSTSDREAIVAIPNQYFKAANFDEGIMKVEEALDKKVTGKAIDIGKAEVVSDGYSTQVKAKTNWILVFFIILLIAIIGYIIFRLIKRKINRDYEKSKVEFAEKNNLDIEDSGDDKFRTASVTKESSTSSKSYTIRDRRTRDDDYDPFRDANPNDSLFSGRKTYADYSGYTPYNRSSSYNNNTTIVNVNNVSNDSDCHHHHHSESGSSSSSYGNGSSHKSSSSSYNSSSDYSDLPAANSSSSSWDSEYSSSSHESSSSYNDSGDNSSSDW